MPSTPVTSSTSSGQSLDQADFLKLLVTQMTSQDPLNPQSDTAFAAQLAQFSALQEAQNTETDLQGLQSNSLIGRTVTVNGTGGTQASGVVSAVQVSSGIPQIVVNNQPYALSQLSAIQPAPTTTPTN